MGFVRKQAAVSAVAYYSASPHVTPSVHCPLDVGSKATFLTWEPSLEGATRLRSHNLV